MTVPMVAHELGDFRIDIFRSDLVIRRVDHEQCVSGTHDRPDAVTGEPGAPI
jgi:hypothetical protein